MDAWSLVFGACRRLSSQIHAKYRRILYLAQRWALLEWQFRNFNHSTNHEWSANFILGCVLFLAGCQSNDSAIDLVFTGNQTTYDLQAGTIHGLKWNDRIQRAERLKYAQLANCAASIKIHFGDVGADRNVILAAGNVGSSFTKANPTGRTGIAACKSE